MEMRAVTASGIPVKQGRDKDHPHWADLCCVEGCTGFAVGAIPTRNGWFYLCDEHDENR